jgi:hypothetical protein
MLPEEEQRNLDRLIERSLQEIDHEKRRVLIQELQREMARLLPTVPYGSNIEGLHLVWPWVKNWGIVRGYVPRDIGYPGEVAFAIWIDEVARR